MNIRSNCLLLLFFTILLTSSWVPAEESGSSATVIEFEYEEENGEALQESDHFSEEYEAEEETLTEPGTGNPTANDGAVPVDSAVRDLSEMQVIGEDESANSFDINLRRSSTIMGAEEIERRQASSVMELVEDMAGISTAGGVRTNGQGFNIRGFSDNEDVLITIDGARQNFERYRYGSGVDIEPDLLQQVEVVRGNNVQSGGAGTVGGAVIMKTKNARDLLEPGESWGVKLKSGYFTNNNQRKGAVTAYAKPFKNADVLFNVVKNSSNDITLPDHSKLPDSETKQLSGLAKVSVFNLDYNIDLAYRYSDESVLEPFDLTGNSGIGGLVRRNRTTRSPTININYDPEPLWLNLDATIAYNDQLVVDSDSALAGGGIDRVGYKILNLELKNNNEIELGSIDGVIHYGVQANRERREYVRISPITGVGFNEAQPPGEKRSYGAFLDGEFNWHNWSFNAGVRYDDYSVSAGGATEEALLLQNRPLENGFTTLNYAGGLTFRPAAGPFQLFYNYGRSFRPPLIDEYYALGPFSRCASFSSFVQRPEQGATPLPVYVGVILPAWQADPFNATQASCADFYEHEITQTHEVGFSTDWQGILDYNDEVTLKFTLFLIKTSNLIESIYQDSVTGKISQPGEEIRRGLEVEFNYDSDGWYGNLALSILNGSIAYNYFDNNSNPIIQAVDPSDRGQTDLFNVPGDTLSLTIGKYIPSTSVELGYRLKMTSERVAVDDVDNTIAGCAGTGFFTVPSCFLKVNEPGYTTHGIFMNWTPNDNVRFALNINNLTNKEYSTLGLGGGTGVPAAGRDIRLSLDYTFD